MIGLLAGKLLSKQPPQVLLEAGGVGYEVETPLSTFERLPEVGSALTLYTHLNIREDAHVLFGFASLQERSLFRELIKLNGVGPKLALAILSGLSVGEFWNIVRTQDASRLTQLPGIGKKTAERLVLELKDRSATLSDYSAPGPAAINRSLPLHEARSALEALGYKPAEAMRMCESVYKAGMSAEQIIRSSLKRMVR